MKTVVIANQKGGVAKTTTSCALASILARMGYKVLAIDMDPQGNLTDNAGVPQNESGVYAVLKGEGTVLGGIVHTDAYDVLPGSILLAAIELELSGAMGREYKLSEAMAADRLERVYDFVIIDTPPALGTLTVNALASADYVLIPTMADVNAAKGIGQLNKTIEMVRKYYNKDLKVVGVLLTRFDPRLTISKKVKSLSEMIAQTMQTKLFDTYIRAGVAAPEASFAAKDLFSFKPNSTVAQDYEAFAKEFIEEVK